MRISDWSSDVCSSDLEILVDSHPDAALRFGGELFDQFVAEGGGKRLSDRGDALRLDRFRIGALHVVERDDHPAAVARNFERLDAVFRHREEQREFGRNRLAVGAEFGAPAADRLHAADVRTGRGDGFAQALAALHRLHDRTRLVASDLLPLGKAPFAEQGGPDLREGRGSRSDDRLHRLDGEFLIPDDRRDMRSEEHTTELQSLMAYKYAV